MLDFYYVGNAEISVIWKVQFSFLSNCVMVYSTESIEQSNVQFDIFSCIDLMIIWLKAIMVYCYLSRVCCRCVYRSAKFKYTNYRSTCCLGLRGADVTDWNGDPASRVFWPSRQSAIMGEPLNSRLRILTVNWHDITGVDCSKLVTIKLLFSPRKEGRCGIFFVTLIKTELWW